MPIEGPDGPLPPDVSAGPLDEAAGPPASMLEAAQRAVAPKGPPKPPSPGVGKAAAPAPGRTPPKSGKMRGDLKPGKGKSDMKPKKPDFPKKGSK